MRFVSLQNYSWSVSQKTFCETNHCISRALRSGLWAYLIHSSVYTLQCSRESSQRCSVWCNTLSDPPKIGVNVSDESALHRMHVLIPAKIQNKSPTCLFIKLLLLLKHQWMRAFFKSCCLFVKNLFAGLNSQLFFYTTLDCIGSGALLWTWSYYTLSVCLSVSLSLSLSLSEGYRFEANQINCVLTGSLRIQSNNALSAITWFVCTNDPSYGDGSFENPKHVLVENKILIFRWGPEWLYRNIQESILACVADSFVSSRIKSSQPSFWLDWPCTFYNTFLQQILSQGNSADWYPVST